MNDIAIQEAERARQSAEKSTKQYGDMKAQQKAKPRIVAMVEYQSSILVATETTIYRKVGDLLVPVKWQVPE